MTHNHHLIEVVHAGAAEGAVGDREARRLDDVRFDTETGGKPQDGPGVLGDVGLEQRDPHDTLPAEPTASIPGALTHARDRSHGPPIT